MPDTLQTIGRVRPLTDDELRLARQWLTKGARDADEAAMFLSQCGIEEGP